MRIRDESRTDWARVDSMTEAELEALIATDPDWADIPRDWYQHAKPHDHEGMRKQVSLRLGPDVVTWFERQGADWEARINAALRASVGANERAGRK